MAKRHRKDELKLNPKLSNEKTNDFLGMAVIYIEHLLVNKRENRTAIKRVEKERENQIRSALRQMRVIDARRRERETERQTETEREMSELEALVGPGV